MGNFPSQARGDATAYDQTVEEGEESTPTRGKCLWGDTPPYRYTQGWTTKGMAANRGFYAGTK